MNALSAMPVDLAPVKFGAGPHINPYEVILDEISRSATQVVFYESKLREAPDDDSLLEEYRPWLNLWTKERERLTRVAAEAIKLGLSERMVRLEERRAEMTARALLATLEALDLPPEYMSRAPMVLRQKLMELDSAH